MTASITVPDPRVTPTLPVEDAGKLLGLSRPSAYAAVRRDDIPVIRIGRRVLVPMAKLLAMLGLGGQP